MRNSDSCTDFLPGGHRLDACVGDDQYRCARFLAPHTLKPRTLSEGPLLWNKRTPDDLSRAVDYFTQAIARDPGYANSYAGLADSYNLLRYSAARQRSVSAALAAATKAVN